MSAEGESFCKTLLRFTHRFHPSQQGLKAPFQNQANGCYHHTEKRTLKEFFGVVLFAQSKSFSEHSLQQPL